MNTFESWRKRVYALASVRNCKTPELRFRAQLPSGTLQVEIA